MDEPVQRTVVLDARLATTRGIGRIEVRRITMAPNVAPGLHVHNGPVVGSIEAGSAIYQIDGGPERTLHPGDVFFEPEGTRIARFDAGEDGVTFLGYFPVAADEDATITFPPD